MSGKIQPSSDSNYNSGVLLFCEPTSHILPYGLYLMTQIVYKVCLCMRVYTTVQKFKVSVFLKKYFYSAMMHSVVSSHSKDIRLKYKTLLKL